MNNNNNNNENESKTGPYTSEEFTKAYFDVLKEELHEQNQKDIAQTNLNHKHDNILAAYLDRKIYSFGIQNGYLKKCECGKTLVLKLKWKNGEKIKTKSNVEV